MYGQVLLTVVPRSCDRWPNTRRRLVARSRPRLGHLTNGWPSNSNNTKSDFYQADPNIQDRCVLFDRYLERLNGTFDRLRLQAIYR